MIASGGESDACQNGAAALAGSCWNSISFAQMVALHAVAWGCEAGAIITEIWHVGHPLAPGERPSYQADRQEAVRICVQHRSGSATMILPIVDGQLGHKIIPIRESNPDLGRFIRPLAPSPAERAKAQALVQRFACAPNCSGVANMEDLAQIATYNPEAVPPKWI